MKKLLSLLLSMALLFQLVVPVWGAETATEETVSILSEAVRETTKTETADALLAPGTRVFGAQYGPLNEGKAVPNRVTPPRYYAAGEFDPSAFYTEDADILETIASGLEQRKTTITVPWRIPANDISTEEDLLALILTALALAMSHTGEPTRGDYLLLGYHYLEYGGDVIAYENGYYYINLVYDNVVYYHTAAQEAALTAKLEQVMASFGFTDATDDYTKIKTIYDYVCANVTYDVEHVYDESYLPMFSAYAALVEGTAVCQGYATLLYRMLLMAGVDNRAIAGTFSGVGHAWNIVRLDNVYYNLDSTWDAGMTEYEFFLKCPDNFPDHTRDAAYDSAEFHAAYPMALADYVYGEEVIFAQGSCGESVTWKLDAEGVLTVSGTGAMEDYTTASQAPWYDYRDYIRGVVVEEGVQHVGDYAFYGYPYLLAVSVDGAQTVGKFAFSHCESLLAVDLLEGVEVIGESAFSGNPNLMAIAIPSTLEKSAAKAFSGCEALTTVVINDLAAWCGIEYELGFGERIATSMPMHSGTQLYLGEEPIADLVIPAEVTTIAPYAFYDVSLNSVTMHDGVTEMGERAFYNTGMKELALSGGLENIPERAFELHDMATVVIPEGVKTIGEFAFRRANSDGAGGMDRSMDAMYLPTTLERLGRDALDCRNLYITDLAAWCGVTRDLLSTCNNTRYPSLYLNGQKVTDLVIPEGVVRIEAHSFAEFSGITTLTLPDSLEYIGVSAFELLSITEIRWGNGVKHIDYDAFDGCNQLTEVTFPASLEKIADGAFSQTKLRSIVFTGHAPAKEGSAASGPFHGITATANYPSSDETWTAEAREALGKFGNLTWVARCAHIFEDGFCTECGAPEALPGDFTGDDIVTNEDVSYLLWHTLFPENYPIDNEADFTGDGKVTNEDVSYLLWHTLFPESYPLYIPASSYERGKKE